MGKARGPYRVGLPSKRGCGTCRGKRNPTPFQSWKVENEPDSHSSADRKVACDQGRPACRNCVASDRTCQGYGLRLSWPATTSRRSIEHRIEENHKNHINAQIALSDASHTHFINTLTKHMEPLYLQDAGYMGWCMTWLYRTHAGY